MADSVDRITGDPVARRARRVLPDPISKDPRTVYVGETLNLLRRAGSTWAARRAFDQLVPNSGKWELEVYELDGSDANTRRGLQSLLIARDKPRMNFLELASPCLRSDEGEGEDAEAAVEAVPCSSQKGRRTDRKMV